LKAVRTTAKGSVILPSGDLVNFQVAISGRIPKGTRLTAKLLNEMIHHKAETSLGWWDGKRVVGASEGDDPSGLKLKLQAWRNPSRKGHSSQAWRSSGSQAARWGSLRRSLARAEFSFSAIR